MHLSNDHQNFLGRVDERLAHLLCLPPEEGPADPLITAGRHLVLAGGKRARPWLVQTLGGVVGADTPGLLDAAVAAELIHAASLLHDDVIDEGRERRGRPTANLLWGNLTAVLSGDLLLTIALQQLTERPPRLLHEAIAVVSVMTRASLVEAALRGQLDVTPTTWRWLAVGKTAELFGWCGAAAALLAGQEEAAERFRRGTRHLGVAFQLANDLDDVLGRTPGKDALADLANRSPCYPLIIAASRSDRARDTLREAWDAGADASADAVRAAVQETGADRATIEAIALEIAEATAALGPWVNHPATAPIFLWAEGLRR